MSAEVKFIRGNDRINHLARRTDIADDVAQIRAAMAEADKAYAMRLRAEFTQAESARADAFATSQPVFGTMDATWRGTAGARQVDRKHVPGMRTAPIRFQRGSTRLKKPHPQQSGLDSYVPYGLVCAISH